VAGAESRPYGKMARAEKVGAQSRPRGNDYTEGFYPLPGNCGKGIGREWNPAPKRSSWKGSGNEYDQKIWLHPISPDGDGDV